MNAQFQPHQSHSHSRPRERQRQREWGPRRPNISRAAIVALVLLLVLPTMAILRAARTFDPRFLAGYLFLFLGITFLLYWRDKRRAEEGAWRIPESTLHLFELLGGWPAAFVAQRVFRHKISKVRYQVIFWVIVALHQVAAFDSLQDWHYLRSALALVRV